MLARDAAQDELTVQLAVSPHVSAAHLDETVLAGLDEQLDLRSLLGGAPRRPGNEWPLSTDALLKLFRPGGELVFEPLEGGAERERMGLGAGWTVATAPVSLGGSARGLARYERAERSDGTRIARITLNGTIETRSLLGESERLEISPLNTERVSQASDGPLVERAIRFEGELLWDLDAQRARTLEIEGSSQSKVTQPFWDEGTSSILEWRGDFHLRVTGRRVAGAFQ